MNRYLIVDCGVRPGAARTLRFYAEGMPHRSLFDGQPEQAHADVGPWLVQLGDGNPLHGWLNALEGTGARVPCVTQLVTEQSFNSVFSHLQEQLELRLADGTAALLRFYDPRVMKRLQRILTPVQSACLLAPFHEWSTQVGRYSRNAN
ncbi:DUF4123 domain-containing protein [Stenotrophomonas sp. Iso1]|uniref:DUF4123 domain-containing protein n=1 Tax=Stenotrophomonas sp. Iso1 TaxID=2977283 RepID=UPI0022B7D39C|nr:DUF4123 domain-containing protein [Stenotrophomonas sp. Iso1]